MVCGTFDRLGINFLWIGHRKISFFKSANDIFEGKRFNFGMAIFVILLCDLMMSSLISFFPALFFAYKEQKVEEEYRMKFNK